MNRINSFLILVFLSFTIGVSAQSPSKILKQAEKALGSAKTLQKVKSRAKKGTITRVRDGANGTYFLQTSAPNFYNESFEFGGFETESGYNGKSGWRRDSREGLRTLTGTPSRDFQTEAVFRNSLWLNYKKAKSKIVSCGQTKINEKPSNCLNLTNAKGVSIKMYFDAATFLLVREEIPAGEILKTFDYSNFRVVNGVQEPFTIIAKIGDELFEIKLEAVVHNRQIARSNFDFPQISDESLPDIPLLLKQLQENQDKTETILENYSYSQKVISRELGKDGILREKESETYQITFFNGYRIRRLIEKNGKPLSVKQQADEDEKVQDEVAKLEKRIVKQESKNIPSDDNNRRVSIAETLRASLLKNPRRERFRGRDVIVFDFEPNPNFDLKNAKSMLKFFGKVGGVMWIDAQDKQIVRIEAMLMDSYKIGGGLLANLKKGATFTLEQERVNDEIWLPSLVDVNMSVKVFLVKGINLNQVVKSYNYNKFKVEIIDSKVDEIKKP